MKALSVRIFQPRKALANTILKQRRESLVIVKENFDFFVANKSHLFPITVTNTIKELVHAFSCVDIESCIHLEDVTTHGQWLVR